MRSASSLLAADQELLWHPYAPAGGGVPYVVRDAHGCRLALEDADGARHDVVDAMASWWCMVHGYNHPKLRDAVTSQAQSLSHVMFGGLTHAPAVQLAEELVRLTPAPLARVFLADSGSVSVEVALKCALQTAQGRGRSRATKVASLRGGYHGDTLGAMSVCDPVGGMHSVFSQYVPEQVFLPQPPLAAHDGVVVDFAAVPAGFDEWERDVRQVWAERCDDIAGIIVEPLLQGAGGMRPYPAACLQVLRELADEAGAVLIFDEIATGFHRLGKMFAADIADVTPDILCVGKALTGGMMSAAAMLCTADIARDVTSSEAGALLHGPTFMANPLACSAALASLTLLRDHAPLVADVETALAEELSPLSTLDGVRRVSVAGGVGVVQRDTAVDIPTATQAAVTAGVWLRPFRDLLYTMPPYVVSRDDVRAIARGLRAAHQASR